jgi:hypothetical protein
MRKTTILTLGLLSTLPMAASAVELSLIRGPMANLGADADASGTVRSIFKSSYAKLWANLKGLTPGGVYQLAVAGNVEAEFTADNRGAALVEFRVAPTASQFALDFDPRGQEITVSDGTQDILAMVYSGVGEPTELIVDERTDLTPAVEGTSGKVRARYLDQKNKTRFILHLLGLERGVYTLTVGGVEEAQIDLTKGRSAMVNFEANKHGPLKVAGKGNGKGPKNRHALDFDPRGQLVELSLNGAVVFSDVMKAKVDALPQITEQIVTLVNSGQDADAAGEAVIITDEAGEITFTVAVTGLPVGSYDIFVGGNPRGSLTVTDDGVGGTSGEIVFATVTDGTQIELDFPLTGMLEVSQGGVIYLSAPLP